MTSETPRTDDELDDARNIALAFECRKRPKETDKPPLVVPVEFARQLERELIAREAELLQERAKVRRLLEARDAAIELWRQCVTEPKENEA